MLAASSGWKVVKVTNTAASLFGHIVAVPAAIPIQNRARAGSGSAFFDAAIAGAKTRIPQKPNESITNATIDDDRRYREDMQMIERASSRCGTPSTFESEMELSSVEEAWTKFGGGVIRSKGLRGGPSVSAYAKRSTLKLAVSDAQEETFTAFCPRRVVLRHYLLLQETLGLRVMTRVNPQQVRI